MEGCCFSIGNSGIWGSPPLSWLGPGRTTSLVNSLDPALFQGEQLEQGLYLRTR